MKVKAKIFFQTNFWPPLTIFWRDRVLEWNFYILELRLAEGPMKLLPLVSYLVYKFLRKCYKDIFAI